MKRRYGKIAGPLLALMFGGILWLGIDTFVNTGDPFSIVAAIMVLVVTGWVMKVLG